VSSLNERQCARGDCADEQDRERGDQHAEPPVAPLRRLDLAELGLTRGAEKLALQLVELVVV
jgi:hypothetical protein